MVWDGHGGALLAYFCSGLIFHLERERERESATILYFLLVCGTDVSAITSTHSVVVRGGAGSGSGSMTYKFNNLEGEEY